MHMLACLLHVLVRKGDVACIRADKDVIPPAPVLEQGDSAQQTLSPSVPWLQSGPLSVSPRVEVQKRSTAVESSQQARWSSHPFGTGTRSSAYFDEENRTDQMCTPTPRQQVVVRFFLSKCLCIRVYLQTYAEVADVFSCLFGLLCRCLTASLYTVYSGGYRKRNIADAEDSDP
jgi:hypothetical protein